MEAAPTFSSTYAAAEAVSAARDTKTVSRPPRAIETELDDPVEITMLPLSVSICRKAHPRVRMYCQHSEMVEPQAR